jgi:hypothetical protein
MAKSIPKVSGMDWIVERLSQQALEPDEFTTEMVTAKTKASRSATRHRLKRMRENGKLTSRKLLMNGVFVNVYKRVE